MTQTFEDIVIGETVYTHECSDFIEVIPKSKVLELLKQVRTATLNQCAKITAADYTTDHSYTFRNLDKNSVEL